MTDQVQIEPRIDKLDLMRRIERLHMSADMKALLAKLIETTVEVGGKIIQVGCRVLSFVFDLAKSYPNITFGVIVALVLSFLISSIPLVGPLLSPILTPILLALGFGIGALQDLMDAPMRNRMSILETQFNNLGMV